MNKGTATLKAPLPLQRGAIGAAVVPLLGQGVQREEGFEKGEAHAEQPVCRLGLPPVVPVYPSGCTENSCGSHGEFFQAVGVGLSS